MISSKSKELDASPACSSQAPRPPISGRQKRQPALAGAPQLWRRCIHAQLVRAATALAGRGPRLEEKDKRESPGSAGRASEDSKPPLVGGLGHALSCVPLGRRRMCGAKRATDVASRPPARYLRRPILGGPRTARTQLLDACFCVDRPPAEDQTNAPAGSLAGVESRARVMAGAKEHRRVA